MPVGWLVVHVLGEIWVADLFELLVEGGDYFFDCRGHGVLGSEDCNLTGR
jgi:hypothetical protein